LPVAVRDVEGSLGTDFYGIYLLGKKVGFAKFVHERVPDALQTGFRATQDLSMKLTAMGLKKLLRMTDSQEFEGTPPFALRRARFVETDGQSTKEITVERKAKGFEALLSAAGERSRRQIAAIDYNMTDVLTPTIWLRRAPKVGDRLITRDFDFEDLKADLETRKVLAAKTSLVNGAKVTFYEVEVQNPRQGFSGVERYDQRAERLLSMVALGMFEMRLEPERLAKNTEYSADLFVLGTVKIDKPLGEHEQVRGLVLEIQGKEAAVLKSGPRQSISANPGGSYTCKLGKAYGQPAQPTAAEIDEALSESPNYPTTHPGVRALVKKAVGNAQTPRQSVERLVHFVHGYITPSYTAEPLSCFEVLKGRKGDCKAFALLFTTLARAAGIPAREVGGLVYMGDDEKAFGGHAWNEVVLEGQWTSVDAACDEVEADATHIRFGTLTDGMMNLLSTLGKLSFKLVKVEAKGP
jgi:hypothetical protein